MDLKQIAHNMTDIYQQNNKIKGILLAGSVSRGWQDKHSDIELHILWSEPPTDEERMSPIKKINGTILDFFDYEDEEWSESYLTQTNVKLEISNFLVETVERFVDSVVRDYDIDFDKQCILASLHFGKILYGEVLLNTLKQKAAHYPSRLTEEMILNHLEYGSRWNNRRALLDREDWVMLYEVVCTVQKKLLAVLFGLNKLYVHHPAFKWMHQSIQLMSIKPDNFDQRMSHILLGDLKEGISELEYLIEEVLDLVSGNYPNLNIEVYRQRAQFVRPEN